MAKSQATFMKKQLEKNRQKKKEDKLQRKTERQQNSSGSDLESMMAYVNEFGEIVSTPPEKPAHSHRPPNSNAGDRSKD
jgi:hypothetical protein